MTRIFISYRRDDAPDMAERICERLKRAFGKGNVFIDVDDIPSGVRFAEYLRQTLTKSDAMLVIIGGRWLTVATPEGNRRLDQPGDFVRLEVESALKQELVLIPVLVQGASVPAIADLPESLRGLVAHQALSVRRNPDFERDAARLIEAIHQQVRQQAQERAAKKRAQRWAVVKQALLKVPQFFFSLLTQPAGRIGCLGLAVLLVVLSTAVLFQTGTLHVFPFVGASGSSTATATPSPTINAVAATQAAAIAQATATSEAATATVIFAAPYVAALPGKCDQGAALWHSFENSGQFLGTISCATDSMVVNGNATAEFRGAAGRAGFTNVDAFPLQYRASVDTSFGPNEVEGAGLGAHFGTRQYNLSIRRDGNWFTSQFDSDQYTGGNAGQGPAAANYTLVITAQGGFVTFSINGAQVDKMQLTSESMQPTGLGMGNGAGGPAYYKNFVFTPLP